MADLIPNYFNLLVVIYVALGSLACSYGMAIIGSTIGQPSFYQTLGLAAPGADGYAVTARWISAFTGVNSAGSAIGALACAYFGDKFGRKRCIQGGAGVLIIGAVICAAAIDPTMFIVGRLVNGLGIGALITIIPTYQAELSTPKSRGFMVSMHGVMIALGYTTQGWISFGIYFLTASGNTSSVPWRFPIAFQIVPALLVLLGSYWLPFSPRWLVMQGRSDEALVVLQRLHRTPEDKDCAMASAELYQIEKQVEKDLEKTANSKSFALFATGPNRRRALIGYLVMFNNQFTGVLIISNYGIILYTSLGMTGYWPLLLTCIWTTSTIPGNIFCALFVERIGRRKLMLIGLSGILMCLVCETALQAVYLGGTNRAGQNAAIAFIFLFITPFWSFCLDATGFLYVAEIFPNHLRSSGAALSTAGLYLGSLVVLMAGPVALETIRWKFFLVLIVPTFFNILFVYFMCPETKGKSLEEIGVAFGENVEVTLMEAMGKPSVNEVENVITSDDGKIKVAST